MKRRKKPTNKLVILPILIGIGLIAYSLFTYLGWHKNTTGPSPEITDSTINYSDPNPSEIKPKCDEYKVPADKPRFINIPSINASGCIIKVGTDQNKAVAAPNSIYLAGWYTGSVLPGDKGVSLIDGHVSGKYADGIFKNIRKLKKSDTFQVEFGDSSTRSFEVVSVSSYSVDDTSTQMLKQHDEVQNQLNLITCTGSFNKNTQQYDKRVIVVSKFIN